MDNDRTNRPDWMNDEQYLIYRELWKVFDAMSKALIAKDRETWQRLTLRLREMNRLAYHKMFT